MGIRLETIRVVAICIALIVVPAITLVACTGPTGPNEPFDCIRSDQRPDPQQHAFFAVEGASPRTAAADDSVSRTRHWR